MPHIEYRYRQQQIHASIISWCVSETAYKSSQTLVPWATVAMHRLSSLKKIINCVF